jgi:N-terminal half of MaoC dehydratase
MAVDVERLKRDWTGFEFDRVEFPVTADELAAYARAVGEIAPCFTDASHPELRAVPNFPTKYHGARMWPADFPRLSTTSAGFDAGKRVEVHGAIRPGDVVTARSSIHDIYEKTGRSGAMVFIVHRMEFSNQRGEPVATVDWRFLQQPDPD